MRAGLSSRVSSAATTRERRVRGLRASRRGAAVGERNDNYDLGELVRHASGGVTDEVIVTAQRQVLEASLDRRVFDLGEDIARATGSVLDAMRGLPGVTVGQEGQIQLRGSDRVAILIDGKQSGLTGIGNQAGLDSIPAGSIRASRSSTIRRRRTTRRAWPASSTSSTGRIRPKDCRSTRASRSASAPSTSASPICRRSWAASRRTRRSIRASISSITPIEAGSSSRRTCSFRRTCRTTSSRRATTTTAA